MGLTSARPATRRLAFLAILWFAFVLRVWGLTARSLWFDEGIEYWSAHLPLAGVAQAVQGAFQPPLYSYLLHFWQLLGLQEFWLRYLSVAVSMLTVVGLMAWARWRLGSRAALIAGALMACLPGEIRYAQEVGEYALMECALVWALYALDVALQSRKWIFWAAYACCALAAIYSHYGTGIVLVSLGLFVWLQSLWQRDRQAAVRLPGVALAVGVAALPLLLIYLPHQLSGKAQFAFAVPFTSARTEVIRAAQAAADTFLFPLTGWPFSRLPVWLLYSAIGLLIGMLLWVCLAPHAPAKRILQWLLVAYSAYFVSVRLGLYGNGSFGFRYGLVLAPLFILSLAAVSDQLLRQRRAGLAAGLLLLAGSLAVYSLPNRPLSDLTRGPMAWPETQDLGDVARSWSEARGAGDVTYVYYGATPAFTYYLQRYGLSSGALPTVVRFPDPCRQGKVSAACGASSIFYGAWIRALSPEAKLRSIRNSLGDYPARLWLVFSHIYPNEDQVILDQLRQFYRITPKLQRTNAALYLLERR